MSVLPSVACRSLAIPLKTPTSYSVDTNKLILNSTWQQKPRNSQHTWKMRTKHHLAPRPPDLLCRRHHQGRGVGKRADRPVGPWPGGSECCPNMPECAGSIPGQGTHKNRTMPWLVGLSGLSASLQTEGHRLDSQSGHRPGFLARSPVGGT